MLINLRTLLGRWIFSWGFFRLVPVALLLAAAAYFYEKPGTSASERLVEGNPKAQAYLDELGTKADASAIEATARYYLSRYKEDGGSCFVRDLSQGKDGFVKLCGTLVKIGHELSDEQLESLSRLAACAEDMKGEASEAALDLLDNSQEIMTCAKRAGGKTWDAVRNDPIAAILYSECSADDKKAKTWEAYCRYPELPWAVPLVAQLDLMNPEDVAAQGDKAPLADSRLNQVLKFVDLCDKYPSLRLFVSDLKQSVEEGDEKSFSAEQILLNLALAYDVYASYGDEMERICSRSVKPAMALDIVALNRDLLEKAKAQGSSEAFCSTVTDICHSDSDSEYLIYAAQQLPGFLQLYLICPRDVASVKPVYWDCGALSLLYAACKDEDGNVNEDALRNGVKALGSSSADLAMSVFEQDDLGGDGERFATVLAMDWRVVPYLSKHGKRGLRGLYEDREKYLNQLNDELTPDGKPKSGQWTEYIPLVGATAKTIKDFVTNRPFDAEDALWAAWEVADVGLMFASGGASKGISTALKSATKSQIRKEGKRRVERNLAKTSLKQTAEQTTKSSNFASKLTRGLAAKKASSMLLTSAVTIGTFSVRIAEGAGRVVGKTGKWLLAHPRTCRFIAWTMLGTELVHRTAPHSREIVQGVIETAAEFATNQIQAIKEAFRQVMDHVFISPDRTISYVCAALALLLLIFPLRPRASRRKRARAH